MFPFLLPLFALLSAPNFVSSMQYGDFVFFFFRETSQEFTNCGKVRRLLTNARFRRSNFFLRNTKLCFVKDCVKFSFAKLLFRVGLHGGNFHVFRR